MDNLLKQALINLAKALTTFIVNEDRRRDKYYRGNFGPNG